MPSSHGIEAIRKFGLCLTEKIIMTSREESKDLASKVYSQNMVIKRIRLEKSLIAIYKSLSTDINTF
jgi:hypothetical protein